MLRFCRATTIVLIIFAIAAMARSADLNQHLRDQYQGKTFLLRGFYSADRLRYDSSGVPDNAAAGDWTVDGFIQVYLILLSDDDRLIIKGQRMAAAEIGGQFELRPVERKVQQSKKVEYVQVEIEADPGMHNPAPEQIDAFISRIFLTPQDSLANLVPDYWKTCLSGGLKGTDKHCSFASDLLAIPGIVASDGNDTPASVMSRERGTLHVGGGVSPPRVIYQRDPEFSEAARAAKFQGTVILWLVVDKEGTPTKVHIAQPLGYGLDEKAIQAVESWKFKPAEKDGVPVSVAIAVEVEFHLY